MLNLMMAWQLFSLNIPCWLDLAIRFATE